MGGGTVRGERKLVLPDNSLGRDKQLACRMGGHGLGRCIFRVGRLPVWSFRGQSLERKGRAGCLLVVGRGSYISGEGSQLEEQKT